MNSMTNRGGRLAQWPWHWHAGAMVVVLAVVGGLVLGWLRYQQRQQASLAAEIERVREQVAGVGTPRPNPSDWLGEQVPTAQAADQVVRDMVAWAQAQGMQLGAVEVQAVPATASTWGAVQFSVTATGGYAGVKAWLGDLLGRYPGLMVQSLAMRPSTVAQRTVELQASLQLVVRD